MSDWTTYAAGLILLGGMVLACYEGIKETEKPKRRKSEWDEVRIVTPIKAQAKPKPAAKAPEKPRKPVKPGPSADTIKAMHKQADAERAIAEALERKAQHITDPVKRARISKQAANSWLRFNKILDQIDKLTASD